MGLSLIGPLSEDGPLVGITDYTILAIARLPDVELNHRAKFRVINDAAMIGAACFDMPHLVFLWDEENAVFDQLTPEFRCHLTPP